MSMMFCHGCGKEIHQTATSCPHCGAPQKTAASGADVSPTGKTTLALICFFFGSFGIHRFMVGKIGTGILMLFTLGAFGIWTLIDFIVIVVGKFRDKQGRLVTA